MASKWEAVGRPPARAGSQEVGNAGGCSLRWFCVTAEARTGRVESLRPMTRASALGGELLLCPFILPVVTKDPFSMLCPCAASSGEQWAGLSKNSAWQPPVETNSADTVILLNKANRARKSGRFSISERPAIPTSHCSPCAHLLAFWWVHILLDPAPEGGLSFATWHL